MSNGFILPNSVRVKTVGMQLLSAGDVLYVMTQSLDLDVYLFTSFETDSGGPTGNWHPVLNVTLNLQHDRVDHVCFLDLQTIVVDIWLQRPRSYCLQDNGTLSEASMSTQPAPTPEYSFPEQKAIDLSTQQVKMLLAGPKVMFSKLIDVILKAKVKGPPRVILKLVKSFVLPAMMHGALGDFSMDAEVKEGITDTIKTGIKETAAWYMKRQIALVLTEGATAALMESILAGFLAADVALAVSSVAVVALPLIFAGFAAYSATHKENETENGGGGFWQS
jgi:hypothetical protein